jgi:hypothetical protein
MEALRELTRGRLDPCSLHVVHIGVACDWPTIRSAAARCSTSRIGHFGAITRSILLCWLYYLPFLFVPQTHLPLRRG